MPCTEPAWPGRSWSLWFVGSLLVLRLIIAPWGDVLIFNDTLDYMRQAELPIAELVMGPFPDIEWSRPSSFPLVLKLLGATRPDDLVTRKAILVFNVFLSTATVGLVALVGRRVFGSEPARAAWAVFVFAFSLTEFVYPWEVAALAETSAADAVLLIAAALAAVSSPPELRWRVLLALLVLSAFLGHLRESLVVTPPALLIALLILRRKESLPLERRVSSAGFAACVGVIVAVTLAMYLQMGQRPEKRAVHLGNFISMRVLRDPGAREALVRDLAPPASVLAVRGIPYWSWTMDDQGRSWMGEYDMRRHLLFLTGHPREAFDLFRNTSRALVSRIGTEEQYRWYWSARNRRPDTVLLGISYFATRLVSAPVLVLRSLDLDLCLFLPVVVFIVLALSGLRLGRMNVIPLLSFLGLLIYSQYLVTALFEGTEDYRVAVVGSEALICFYWLSGATLAESLQWRRIAEAAVAAAQRRTARRLAYTLVALLLLVVVAGAYWLKTRAGSLEAVMPETRPIAVGAPPQGQLPPASEAEIQAGMMKAGLDALHKRHDPIAAAAEFRKLLERNPNHYGATYQLATALDRAGKRAEARALWEKVLTLAEGYKDEATLLRARERLAVNP